MRESRTSLSRRRLLAGGAGLAAGATLAGCFGDEHANSGGDGPAFPNMVMHQFGTTEIPAMPQRIVCLGPGDADALLALGIAPAGILHWGAAWPQGVGPWAQSKLGGAKPVTIPGPSIDFDAVAAIAPDMVTFTRSDNDYAIWKRLNDLAPTISAPRATAPYGTSWQDQAITIAGAIVRRAEGDRAISETEAALAAARNANPGFAGKTVCLATVSGDGYYHAYVRQDDRVRLIEALGFTNSPRIERTEPKTSYYRLSRESADWLDADLTIILANGTAAVELRNDPALNAIPSAKAGRLLIIDDAGLADALSANTVLSIPYALARLVPPARKALAH